MQGAFWRTMKCGAGIGRTWRCSASRRNFFLLMIVPRSCIHLVAPWASAFVCIHFVVSASVSEAVRYRTMPSIGSCQVQDHARYRIMPSIGSCQVSDYSKYRIMPSIGSCQVQDLTKRLSRLGQLILNASIDLWLKPDQIQLSLGHIFLTSSFARVVYMAHLEYDVS